jgi:hypothetical protein
VLSGTEERRPDLGPRDLGQRAALAEVTRDDVGHGPLERGVLRPRGELIEFVVAKLSVPLDPGDTSGPRAYRTGVVVAGFVWGPRACRPRP